MTGKEIDSEKTVTTIPAGRQAGRLRVLVACEESQRVCSEFRRLGHEAYSCDLMDTSGEHDEWHLKADALQLLKIEWDLVIAFPPCTYLSNAGACRLYPKKGQMDMERYKKGLEAKAFFLKFWENDNCKHVAIENPVASKVYEMPQCSQEIQPWQFGHPVTKRTRLWLKGLPPLLPTEIVEPTAPYLPAGTSRKDASKYGRALRTGEDAVQRSKTFPGIARAMAEQWSAFLLDSTREE